MHRCELAKADAFVDGQPFRFDELAEFNTFRKLGGLRGIEIVDVIRTSSRLQFEHKACLKAKKAKKKG